MNLDILITIGVLLALIIFQLYFGFISKQKLNALINNYFKKEEFEIVKIRKLTLREKVRYNEAQVLVRFYSLGLLWLISRLGERYFRVIEMSDSKGNEKQIFIEAYIIRRKLKKLTIFDSYEI